MRDHHYYVYMVKCRDGSYYTGVTNSVDRRVMQHNQGQHRKSYTFARRPIHLVYTEQFQYIQEAITWEKRLKKWSRPKKEALIARKLRLIEQMSACRNLTHHRHFPLRMRIIVTRSAIDHLLNGCDACVL